MEEAAIGVAVEVTEEASAGEEEAVASEAEEVVVDLVSSTKIKEVLSHSLVRVPRCSDLIKNKIYQVFGVLGFWGFGVS